MGLLGFWCKLLKTREIEPVCKVCNGRCKILWRKLLSLHFSELLMRNAVTQSHVTSYTCKILWCEKWGANWCRCRAMNANHVAAKKEVSSDPVQCPYTLGHVPIGVGHNPIPCLTCHLEVRPHQQQLQCRSCRRWQQRVCRQAKLGNRSGVNLQDSDLVRLPATCTVPSIGVAGNVYRIYRTNKQDLYLAMHTFRTISAISIMKVN